MKRVLDFYDEIVKCVCSIERRVDKRADVVRWSEILKDFDLEFAVYVPKILFRLSFVLCLRQSTMRYSYQEKF